MIRCGMPRTQHTTRGPKARTRKTLEQGKKWLTFMRHHRRHPHDDEEFHAWCKTQKPPRPINYGRPAKGKHHQRGTGRLVKTTCTRTYA